MKKAFILILLTIICIATYAQEKKNIRIRAIGKTTLAGHPRPTRYEKDRNLSIVKWPDTEYQEWHDTIGIVKNVPTINNNEISFPWDDYRGFTPMTWKLVDEGKNTVLHCYMKMPSDIVTNFWLGSGETVLLDQETGIIYQPKATVPAECYNKVFSIESKKGSVLDFQIVYNRLPDKARKLKVYGLPEWKMRGTDIQRDMVTTMPLGSPDYDQVPKFHLPKLVKDSLNYDRNVNQSWAVYKDVHTIKPVENGTLALWRTKDATYLAMATEQNWYREWWGYGGNSVLMDDIGHRYKCKGLVGFQNDRLFWVEGYPGDYFAIVLIFEPIPLDLDTFSYIEPEGEPINMWGANWSGEVRSDLKVSELRQNQKLFNYHKRIVVK